MRPRPNYMWIPLWIDKWIFGSTRIELTLEERGIWVDFLALAGKDDGWIRANKDTPYPLEQLAGLLIIPVDKLISAIEKFKNTGKITIEENGVIRIVNWDNYKIENAYKRVIKYRVMHEQNLLENSLDEEEKTFIKPTVEEIKEYCLERNNDVDAQMFYDFYESKGWFVGKSRMKNWKAAVRTWEGKGKLINARTNKRYIFRYHRNEMPTKYNDKYNDLETSIDNEE